MNIKPPIFSNLPSQVSPEWRWFWSSVPSLVTNHENLFNYGTGENLILINSPIVTVGSLGRGYETLYSDLDAFRVGQSYDLSSGKDWTFVCVRKGTASSTTIGFDHDDAVIVGKGDYDTNPSYALRESVGSGLTNLIWKWFGGTITGTENIANQNWITPRPTRVIGAKNYAGGSLSLWLDGQEIGNGSWSQSDPDDDLILGANETDTPTITLAGTHRWYATYIFPVVLTDGQMRQLAEDPFGPFRQANRLFLPDLPRSFGSVVVPSDTQRQPITFTTNPSPELISDTGFDNPSNWTATNGLSVSNSQLIANNAVNNQVARQTDLTSVIGKTYKVTFDIVEYTTGDAIAYIGSQNGTRRNAVGTYTEIITATGASWIGIMANNFGSTSTWKIDNFSVKELADSYVNISQAPELVTNGGFDTDTDWNKDTGWTISGGKLRATSAGNSAAAFQTRLVEIGETVMVTFTVDSISEGAVKAFVGGSGTPGAARTAPGTYREIFVANASNTTGLVASGTTTCVIDNFSVRRVNIKITP